MNDYTTFFLLQKLTEQISVLSNVGSTISSCCWPSGSDPVAEGMGSSLMETDLGLRPEWLTLLGSPDIVL